MITERKNWLDHVLREELLKGVIQSRMISKRPRGQKRIAILDLIKDNSNTEIKRKAEDRKGRTEWMPATCQQVKN